MRHNVAVADEGVQSRDPSSLDELAGRCLSFEEVRQAFAAAFRDELGASESDLTQGELTAAARILDAKYASDEWNLAY